MAVPACVRSLLSQIDPQEMVLSDERAVIAVGSYQKKFGVTLSLPSIIGRDGVVEVLEPDLSDQERQKLDESANHLRQALARLQRT